MVYLCANFGLPRSLCSRLRPDVRDIKTDVRRASSLNSPAMGQGHNSRLMGWSAGPFTAQQLPRQEEECVSRVFFTSRSRRRHSMNDAACYSAAEAARPPPICHSISATRVSRPIREAAGAEPPPRRGPAGPGGGRDRDRAPSLRPDPRRRRRRRRRRS